MRFICKMCHYPCILAFKEELEDVPTECPYGFKDTNWEILDKEMPERDFC